MNKYMGKFINVTPLQDKSQMKNGNDQIFNSAYKCMEAFGKCEMCQTPHWQQFSTSADIVSPSLK